MNDLRKQIDRDYILITGESKYRTIAYIYSKWLDQKLLYNHFAGSQNQLDEFHAKLFACGLTGYSFEIAPEDSDCVIIPVENASRALLLEWPRTYSNNLGTAYVFTFNLALLRKEVKRILHEHAI